ncbi:hypothetical protein B14911_10567 [Bacillus sp. NRRL B-14911]|nr:hypothetical protein B14911_10567 [Bacillus sp. NRRL B-14911]
MVQSEDVLTSAIQLFPREDNSISLWDHPNFKSRVTLPDNYFAITRVEQGLEMVQQGRLNEEALTVMKVIGDAMCANENQLRRYLSKKQSFSQTSSILKRLRKYGFVERHKCRLAFIEEDGEETIKPPAPFTLGIAGYKLMKHLYPKDNFKNPEIWSEQPLSIQRYVAVNELRCLLVEARVLRGWKWNPYIGGSSKYMKPQAVAKLETAKGELQFILERPQMAQNFVGYFRSKLEQYRYLYERDQFLQVDGFGRAAVQVVCLYTSSASMAKFIHEEIGLHCFPFQIWVVVDEWINESKGMSEAFLTFDNGEMKRIRLPFLQNS